MRNVATMLQCKMLVEVDVPREKGMTRSLSMTLPDSSRKRSGRNCCGCCQSSGSMWALCRFTKTCVNNQACTNLNIITIRLAIYGGRVFIYATQPRTIIFLSQRLNITSKPSLCRPQHHRAVAKAPQTAPQMKIWQFSRCRPYAILDLFKFKILTVAGIKSIKMYHQTKRNFVAIFRTVAKLWR